jgi:bifunctional oligoribonuclease and PAP phosphatase NrnA
MFRKIKELVEGNERFLITSHIDPDGDAIGSAFSLYRALDSMQKKAVVYLKDMVPYQYAFLPRPAGLTHEFPDDGFDVIFVVDCGNLFRVGDGYERLNTMGTLINIDHHKTSETFGEVNLIDENACCTAELLHSFYQFSEITVSAHMALDIYTAVLTDTGSFHYENTNLAAFIIAERMVRAGVKPAYVSEMVYNSHPKERFKLLGLSLSELETYDDDTVVMAYVTEEMFRKAHAGKELTEGFAEFIKEMRGVQVAIFLRELPRTGYKVSMRSKGIIDVAAVCSLFGGGGHKNAAGCTIEGDLPGVKNRLKEALRVQ